MRFHIEDNFDAIRQIHPQIFNTPFPEESCHKKRLKGDILLPVGFYHNDKLVGYCIVVEKVKEKTLRAWTGGILPSNRGHGGFSLFYTWLIELAEDRQYCAIKANTDNYKPAMIRTLVKHGFDIIGVSETPYGDGRKIEMRYTVHAPIKLRISITNTCNLCCFFCHHEGISSSTESCASVPEIERLLIQAHKLNTQEITITGGEPLIRADLVKYILKYCSEWARSPLIKLITNGLLLSEDILKAASEYPAEFRVHISLHSLRNDKITQIYGRAFSLESYDKNAALLRQYQIPFRFNCVILNGLNSSSADMEQLIKYAIKNGAESVHFMELLVAQGQTDLYMYYFSADKIELSLQKLLDSNYHILTSHHTAKKKVFQIFDEQSEKEIIISVYRLSCRSGCQNCVMENDITIGSDMRCYPCYLQTEKDCGNASISLARVIAERERFLMGKDDNYSLNQLFWGDESL